MADQKETKQAPIKDRGAALAVRIGEILPEIFGGEDASLNDLKVGLGTVLAMAMEDVPEPDKTVHVEDFVKALRERVNIAHNPSLCLTCAFRESIERKYPEGLDDHSGSDVMSSIAKLTGFILANSVPENYDSFIAALRKRYGEYKSEGVGELHH